MFHRRKSYLIKSEFAETLNEHFNKTNLPNQVKHGSRLIGRWMKDNKDGTTEIFAIWEYDSYEDYLDIESAIRNDSAHVARVKTWYDQHGGREFVLKEYMLEVKNEVIESTIERGK
ncbi:NIPSNAP family protein [Lentibacillus sediminis]|uniref:NIPSNAP family protein n=1 Tax=Lentibacillus sediminis TaxID=1940529 RepID=UPI000C1C8342|nr:NIPSNAP family protein [Lentibacillus sediminis]